MAMSNFDIQMWQVMAFSPAVLVVGPVLAEVDVCTVLVLGLTIPLTGCMWAGTTATAGMILAVEVLVTNIGPWKLGPWISMTLLLPWDAGTLVMVTEGTLTFSIESET